MEKSENTYSSYKLKPPTGFSDIFSHFYWAENYSKLAIKKILSPSSQTILIFNLSKNPLRISTEKHQLSIKKYMVLRPLKKAVQYIIPAQGKFFCNQF